MKEYIRLKKVCELSCYTPRTLAVIFSKLKISTYSRIDKDDGELSLCLHGPDDNLLSRTDFFSLYIHIEELHESILESLLTEKAWNIVAFSGHVPITYECLKNVFMESVDMWSFAEDPIEGKNTSENELLQNQLIEASKHIKQLEDQLELLRSDEDVKPKTAAASKARQRKVAGEYKIDITAAVKLAVQCAQSGEPHSQNDHETMWLELRGEKRQASFRSFRNGLPQELKKKDSSG